ncbi:UDP-glucosyltransferase 2-like [Rhopalosiphum padi]|uniref:UDP-glucosyltransferase 2-like n=1 Tax=Rhopalosiphum padi TaxID=40932 RepID=UPI00298DB4C4|nr:UDP-glucosyltransferase 2-like [Rhopalosiphum padi]XP_060833726.1 UDP-glucosyltransferase 2-like [Rhopalosiphum padi]
MKCVGLLLVAVMGALSVADGANILGVFPINGRSHWVVYESVMKALAARGHNVTVITSFPQKAPVANYTDIDVSATFPAAMNTVGIEMVLKYLSSVFANQWFIADHQMNICRKAQKLPQVQALLRSDIKFDAVFTEIFGADCDVGFAYHFKAPLLSIMSSSHLPWSYDRVGGPDNPSYIPTIVTRAAGKMNFKERMINTLYYIYFKLAWKYYSEWPANELLKENFGPDVPHINEIVYNTSMVFVNGHFSLDGPRPLVPNMVEIGGIHVKPPRPLPKDILKFIDDSPNGVMFFTFGSLIRVSTLPPNVLQMFKNVFSKLPIRVLWKYEEEMQDKPDNVYISKWMPQRDILSHPKVRLFMTHGGLLGVLEAVHSSVPIIGVPFFFDQPRNILKLVEQGSGILLDYESMTEDILYNAITTIINNSSYAINAKKLSKRFKDRPLNATESAVYWTEYVIRHKGAKHLRTAAVGMPWWKYYLVDVIGFITLIIFAVLYLNYIVFKTIYKKLFKKTVTKKKEKKN